MYVICIKIYERPRNWLCTHHMIVNCVCLIREINQTINLYILTAMGSNRRRVVYGTANNISWEKSPEKHKPTSPNSNLFLYHAPHHILAGKVKHHLKGKGLAIVGIRIDVASNALAKLNHFV